MTPPYVPTQTLYDAIVDALDGVTVAGTVGDSPDAVTLREAFIPVQGGPASGAGWQDGSYSVDILETNAGYLEESWPAGVPGQLAVRAEITIRVILRRLGNRTQQSLLWQASQAIRSTMYLAFSPSSPATIMAGMAFAYVRSTSPKPLSNDWWFQDVSFVATMFQQQV